MQRLLLLALASFTIAQADLIPVIVGSGGTNCTSGLFGTCEYNYTATIHGEAMLTARTDDYREFFTIYDFNGFVDGSVVSPADWVYVPGGLTPSQILTGPAIDNPFIPDITWEYVGPVDLPGGTLITGFKVQSNNGPGIVQGFFSSQATVITQSPGETWDQNIGHVDVPNPQSFPGDVPEIPEPMSMALMGSGLVALGLVRKFRK